MNKSIPQTAIQEILDRTDLIEMIQPRLTLKKHGKNFFAQCPFHSENSPSFCVNAEKQFYYCFGCKASGNAIHFLMNYDKMEFSDAIHYLAAKTGVDLSSYDTQGANPSFNDLYHLLDKITIQYQKSLKQSAAAIAYLKKRGLSGKIAKEFRLGYAPDQWNFIAKYAKSNHPLLQNLLTTGMIIENKQRCYDRFRHRVMFPIRNLRGQVVGYGGRTIQNQQPKYLNSPETPLFHKSELLYGLYEAKQKNRSLEKILIVEGYMDVIGLAQHGIHYAVATLGTAINRKHLQLLLRHCTHLIFCFDGDMAGRQAAWQALKLALPFLQGGIHIRFQFLPNHEDPDSYIQKIGKEKFETYLTQALALEEVFFEKLQQEFPLHSLENKAHFAKNALELIQQMPKGIYQSLLQEKIDKMLQIKTSNLENKTKNETKISSRKNTNQQLTPWQWITVLLLKEPTLIKLLPSTDHFLQEIKPYTILNQLIEILKENEKNPLSTGHLLMQFSPSDQTLLASLAARPLNTPREGMAVELLGGIQRLKELHSSQFAKTLIDKGKKFGLSEEEKKLLQELLATKKQKDH